MTFVSWFLIWVASAREAASEAPKIEVIWGKYVFFPTEDAVVCCPDPSFRLRFSLSQSWGVGGWQLSAELLLPPFTGHLRLSIKPWPPWLKGGHPSSTAPIGLAEASVATASQPLLPLPSRSVASPRWCSRGHSPRKLLHSNLSLLPGVPNLWHLPGPWTAVYEH